MGEHNEIDRMCLDYNPGQLIAHDMGNGRIDMEFVSELQVSEDGWFYVYDAHNDGDLSQAEDKAFIGGDRYYGDYGDNDPCNYIVTDWGVDVSGDSAYETHFANDKMRVIRHHIGSLLAHDGLQYFTEGKPEYTTDENGYVTSFTVTDYCGTVLNIDDKTFPYGMKMIRNAISVAEVIDKAALALGVHDRKDTIRDMNRCNNSGRSCDIYDNQPMWAALEKKFGELTSPCSPEWKPYDLYDQLRALNILLGSLPRTLNGIIKGSQSR